MPASFIDSTSRLAHHLTRFEGNISPDERFRRRELGTAADRPRRIHYERLVT